jgi:hypothetical protein
MKNALGASSSRATTDDARMTKRRARRNPIHCFFMQTKDARALESASRERLGSVVANDSRVTARVCRDGSRAATAARMTWIATRLARSARQAVAARKK